MVVLFRNPLLLHGVVRGCQFRFEGPDAAHLVLGIFLGVARQHEEVLHVVFRGFADQDVLRILGRVVVLVAQGQTALADGDDIVVGIFFVCTDIQAEEQIVVLLGAVLQQVLARFDGIDFRQMGLQRSGTVGVQADGVHGHVVEVADLLGDAAFFVVLGGKFLDQAGQGLGVVFTEFRECAPGRILLRLRVEIDPVSGGILGEIVTGTHGGVHVIIVDAGILVRLPGSARAGGKACCGKHENHFETHITRVLLSLSDR